MIVPKIVQITASPGDDCPDILYALFDNGRVGFFFQGWRALPAPPDDLFNDVKEAQG